MGELDDRYVEKAKNLVVETFPEMAGAEPSVSEKRSRGKAMERGPAHSSSPECRRRYVLKFQKDVSLPGGQSLKRLVRVTMDESGEVVKLTSSK